VLGVLALPAVLLALAPSFESSIEPLPRPVQRQLKTGGFWHKGCPVPLSGLRLLSVSYRDFRGRTRPGQVIVNRAAAGPLARVFRRLYALHFPIHHMRLAVDLNPVENPYVGCGQSRDPSAARYRDRSRHRRGMVTRRAIKAFGSIGWGWGGAWSGNTKDYMHFSSTGH